MSYHYTISLVGDSSVRDSLGVVEQVCHSAGGGENLGGVQNHPHRVSPEPGNHQRRTFPDSGKYLTYLFRSDCSDALGITKKPVVNMV